MKHIRKSPLQTSPPPPVASNRLELEPLDHPSMTTLDLSQASSAGGGVSMGGSDNFRLLVKCEFVDLYQQ